MAIKHKIRADGAGKMRTVTLTARKAIQYHCVECMGFQNHEVKKCTSPNCALFPFRLRTRPVGTD